MKYQVILIVLYKSSSCQAEGNTAIDFVLHSVAQSSTNEWHKIHY